MRRASICLLYCLTSLLGRAETWPSLEDYVRDCALIVKARQVGPFTDRDGAMLTFEVLESWKGQFDPKLFATVTPEGYLRAGQGEHGVNVVAGQEIIFFYTRRNQSEDGFAHHSTSFPIEDGKVVYGRTSDGGARFPKTYTVEEFKKKIQDIRASESTNASVQLMPSRADGVAGRSLSSMGSLK